VLGESANSCRCFRLQLKLGGKKVQEFCFMNPDSNPAAPRSSIPEAYAPPKASLGGAPDSPHPHVHPWLFMILIIPFGVATGYVSVALGYQLGAEGVAVSEIAALGALGLLPHTWKFFWAPVVDATLDQKRWYLLAGLLSAVGIGVLGFFPATKPGLVALSVVVFTMSLATTVLGMAVESLMAHCTPDELKGRAGGWFQAGNLGGAGIGGGLGLLLAENLPAPWMASVIVGVLCFLCCFALAGLPTPERAHGEVRVMVGIWKSLQDLWVIAKRRAGLAALILCFLPLGTGAASGLWAPLASEWNASANTVALVTGLLGGIVSAAGCIAGGWFCDRIDRKTAYVWFGLLHGAAAVGMALLPRSEGMFITWTLIYAFITGLTFAGFTAFVLEAIGKGAAATKYSAFASLSNIPIAYMTVVNGRAHDAWNSSGMLFTEAACGVAAAIAFVVLVKTLLRKPASPQANVTFS
jgi:PAT family beta-lactamase induction signal transducer AmpG